MTRPARHRPGADANPPRLRVHGPPYQARHGDLRAEVRGWLAEHVTPHVEQWEAAREFPRELFAAAGAAGLLGWKYGPQYGGGGPDLLADMVISEELACCGSGGVAAGLGATKDLAPYYLARFGGERVALAVAAVAAASEDLDRVARWQVEAGQIGGGQQSQWWQLARRLASARALAYAALGETIEGREAVASVSAAKWLACDLAVETATLRLAAAQPVSAHEATVAERALRDARLGPIGGGAREVMAELVARSLQLA